MIMRETVTQRVRSELVRLVQPDPKPPYSIRQVAKITGVPVSTICRFLQGRTIESDTLDRLAAFVSEEQNGDKA